jgi:RNA polymerase sigma-B factor
VQGHSDRLGPVFVSSPRSTSSDELFARWRERRDRSARDELVDRFMPMARKLARRYVGAHEPFEDLLQVASLGLVKAVDRFDAGRGAAFSSFAVPTIVGELKRYFRDCGWSVHVPRGLQELALKVAQAERELSVAAGRSPTAQELAQYLEVSIEDVIDALEASAAHHATSLDTQLTDHDGESATLGETLGEDDPRFEIVDATVTIGQAAQALSEREREVITRYFMLDQTQAQIATSIGVSQMQVSRILRRAIERLREQTLPGCPIRRL